MGGMADYSDDQKRMFEEEFGVISDTYMELQSLLKARNGRFLLIPEWRGCRGGPMGDMADYYGNQEYMPDEQDDEQDDDQMFLNACIKRSEPEGYFRQRDGELTQIAAMSLQHLANTLRMIECSVGTYATAVRWVPLRDEWVTRGFKEGEWRKEHFSQEVYEKMLKSR